MSNIKLFLFTQEQDGEQRDDNIRIAIGTIYSVRDCITFYHNKIDYNTWFNN